MGSSVAWEVDRGAIDGSRCSWASAHVFLSFCTHLVPVFNFNWCMNSMFMVMSSSQVEPCFFTNITAWTWQYHRCHQGSSTTSVPEIAPKSDRGSPHSPGAHMQITTIVLVLLGLPCECKHMRCRHKPTPLDLSTLCWFRLTWIVVRTVNSWSLLTNSIEYSTLLQRPLFKDPYQPTRIRHPRCIERLFKCRHVAKPGKKYRSSWYFRVFVVWSKLLGLIVKLKPWLASIHSHLHQTK